MIEKDLPFYSITVDGVMIVRKTSDPDRFDELFEELDPEVRKIGIKVYDGASNNNTHHIFDLAREESQIGGSSTDHQVEILRLTQKHDLEILKKDHEIKDLTRALNNADKRLEARKKTITDLRDDLQKLKDTGNLNSHSVGAVLSTIGKRYMPVSELLGAILPGEPPPAPGLGAVAPAPSPAPQPEPKVEPEQEPNEKIWCDLYSNLKDLPEDKFLLLYAVVSDLIHSPELIEDVQDILT